MAAAAPHVMVLPLPAQGHVTPLMELSHCLVEHGFEVTFVCTEPIHALVLDALRQTADGREALAGIHLVSVPDGLADGDDRRDLRKVVDGISRCVPGHVEKLIRRTEVTWLVADVFWKGGSFPKRRGAVELAAGMPPLYPSHMPWSVDGGGEAQRACFDLVRRNAEATAGHAEIVVCNSFLDAEAAAFALFPDVLPVGPLSATGRSLAAAGQFLPEDTSCLAWLDARPDRSVVYAAFGTSAVFDARQLRELGEGLELAGRPFLWAARPDLFLAPPDSEAWLDEFRNRVAAGNVGGGMVVGWCAQQRVLAHRAVACFVSHCGWNSAVEALRNGVPTVCWPHKADQFANRSYVCDVWRTGVAVAPGEDGVVTKEEVSAKVGQVVGDGRIAERARVFRDAARRSLREGGSSFENFKRLASLLKE